MADIKCPVCCEPWDIDELHEYVRDVAEVMPKVSASVSFSSVYDAFKLHGCGVAFDLWKVSCEPDRSGRGVVLAGLADLLGDDVDGFAALCDDLDMLGGW